MTLNKIFYYLGNRRVVKDYRVVYYPVPDEYLGTRGPRQA